MIAPPTPALTQSSTISSTASRAAVITAQQQWLNDDEPGPIGPLILQALAQVRAGLPAPG